MDSIVFYYLMQTPFDLNAIGFDMDSINKAHTPMEKAL
jgi:hypothetical protein